MSNTTVSAPNTDDLDTSGMRLTFDDEFKDGLSLWNGQSGIWRTVFGTGGPEAKANRSDDASTVFVDPTWTGANGQMKPLDPFSVTKGVLSIAETRLTAAQSADNWHLQYASGLLTTKMSFSQEYGYFEVRAKLPSGQGMWPAFWMLTENNTWPPEIDVLEQLGKSPNTIYMTSHSEAVGTRTQVKNTAVVPDAAAEFHNYGVLWTAQTLTWYVDGQAVAATRTPADMHTPMYMLLDLSVGGAWGGGVTAATPSGQSLQIDWVRAYSLGGAASDGSAIAPDALTLLAPDGGNFTLDRSHLSMTETGVQAVIKDLSGAGVWTADNNDWLTLNGFSPGSTLKWIQDAPSNKQYGVYDIHDTALNHDFLIQVQSTDRRHLSDGDFHFY